MCQEKLNFTSHPYCSYLSQHFGQHKFIVQSKVQLLVKGTFYIQFTVHTPNLKITKPGNTVLKIPYLMRSTFEQSHVPIQKNTILFFLHASARTGCKG